MKLYLLDTSALLAHYFDEPGANQVQSMFEDRHATVLLSALSVYEFRLRLSLMCIAANTVDQVSRAYLTLFDEVVVVHEGIARQAVQLRIEASERIDAIQALIAATAMSRGAILVHRDPHFLSIGAETFRQVTLPDKA